MQNLLSSTAVEVKSLTKSFVKGKLAALRDVSFSVADGEMIALVGASDSGKSTLLRNINGLQQAEQGSVEIYGTTLQSNGSLHSKVRKIRSQIGFIFQQFNLVNRLTVIEIFYLAIALLILVYSGQQSDLSVIELIQGGGNMAEYISRYFPPDFRDWRLYLQDTIENSAYLSELDGRIFSIYHSM